MKRISLMLLIPCFMASQLSAYHYSHGGHYYGRRHGHSGAAFAGGLATGIVLTKATERDSDPVAREEARQIRDERRDERRERKREQIEDRISQLKADIAAMRKELRAERDESQRDSIERDIKRKERQVRKEQSKLSRIK